MTAMLVCYLGGAAYAHRSHEGPEIKKEDWVKVYKDALQRITRYEKAQALLVEMKNLGRLIVTDHEYRKLHTVFEWRKANSLERKFNALYFLLKDETFSDENIELFEKEACENPLLEYTIIDILKLIE